MEGRLQVPSPPALDIIRVSLDTSGLGACRLFVAGMQLGIGEGASGLGCNSCSSNSRCRHSAAATAAAAAAAAATAAAAVTTQQEVYGCVHTLTPLPSKMVRLPPQSSHNSTGSNGASVDAPDVRLAAGLHAIKVEVWNSE